MKSEREKFLRNQETDQLDRYLGLGRKQNGGRKVQTPRRSTHTSLAKSAKRARAKAKRA
jgi:hypothetical protein